MDAVHNAQHYELSAIPANLIKNRLSNRFGSENTFG